MGGQPGEGGWLGAGVNKFSLEARGLVKVSGLISTNPSSFALDAY